ncbi:MAG: toll/interleukin-1 receptor domain-containing protein [Methylococcales bacterium]
MDRPRDMPLPDSKPPTRVFLSYSRKDHVVCKALHANLVKQGLDVTIDVEDIPPGEELQSTISQLIDASDCSVVVLSKNSLNSFWVFWEIQRSLNIQEFKATSRLIPVFLDQSYRDNQFMRVLRR